MFSIYGLSGCCHIMISVMAWVAWVCLRPAARRETKANSPSPTLIIFTKIRTLKPFSPKSLKFP